MSGFRSNRGYRRRVILSSFSLIVWTNDLRASESSPRVAWQWCRVTSFRIYFRRPTIGFTSRLNLIGTCKRDGPFLESAGIK